jgi:hypothetical protein
MSAAGILLTADRAFPPGSQIQLSMDWPGLYHDAEQMLLVVTATVIRSAGKRTALQILHHEFLHVAAAPRSRTITPALTLAAASHSPALGPRFQRRAKKTSHSSSLTASAV